ncbi:MAG TPA: ORF6N domain-containing protein, partial [Bacteroidia bacterium]|nr:ORF6N domain-containing protein [Bacteroidia bacterium]
RNITRFPTDFMFQLTEEEYSSLKMQPFLTDADQPVVTPEKNLKSQNATSKGTKATSKSQNATSSSTHGGRRTMPYVFTEHGTVMLASVLNSPKAVHASIQVVKAFVRLRELMLANKDLAKKLDSLEEKYDKQFAAVFDAVRRLMEAPEKPAPRKRIGYKRKSDAKE